MQKSNQMASFSIHFPNINGLQLLCEIRVIAGWSFWGCSDFKSQNVKKKKKQQTPGASWLLEAGMPQGVTVPPRKCLCLAGVQIFSELLRLPPHASAFAPFSLD